MASEEQVVEQSTEQRELSAICKRLARYYKNRFSDNPSTDDAEDPRTILREVFADLRDEIKADDILLRGRKQLTDALDDISECRPHGRECVPHALDVIAELRKDKARLEALQNVKILATVMSMPTGMPTREAIDKAMEESDESDG